MRVLLVSLIGVGFVGLVIADIPPEDGYAVPEVSGQKPLELDSFAREQCDYGRLVEAIREIETLEGHTRTRDNVRQHKFVDFCRQEIESDIMEALERVDAVSREQAIVIGGAIIKADAGRYITGMSFYMPINNRAYQEGILDAMARIGGDLSSIRDRAGFEREYQRLVTSTCKAVADSLRQPVREYRVFASNHLAVAAEPFRWGRYTEICSQIIDSGFEPFGSGAYRLREVRLAAAKSNLRKAIMKKFKKTRKSG